MVHFDAFKHHRSSMRLKERDYAASGAYFVTICTHDREDLLGEIVEGKMHLNECGHIVAACWEDIPRHFGNVRLDAFTILPNHIHGVIVITSDPAGVGVGTVGVGIGDADIVGAKHS